MKKRDLKSTHTCRHKETMEWNRLRHDNPNATISKGDDFQGNLS